MRFTITRVGAAACRFDSATVPTRRIADHPELCRWMRWRFPTGSTARQVTKIDASAAGVTQCVFTLQVTERADDGIKGARIRT
jgi:hypothetical protein